MNINLKRFLLCPIPEDQKPITLYQAVKENAFMNWVTWSQKKYDNYVFSFSFFAFGVWCFLRFPFLPSNAYLLEWVLTNLVLGLVNLILFLAIIFFRWKQVEMLFCSTKIFYEEGSWSDGQIWEKPSIILKTDQLIRNQKINPILQRITRTLYSLSAITLLFILLFEIL